MPYHAVDAMMHGCSWKLALIVPLNLWVEHLRQQSEVAISEPRFDGLTG